MLENFDGRLASRHFRNQLALLREEWSSDSDRDLLEDFKEFASEWAPEIELRELEVGGQVNLYYRETGRRSEKEIFWAGDGYQVWLQLLLHLFRLRDIPSIVLDEPDVFLHADLQRRLVRLIESFECQAITATHSPEMLAEAPAQAVIWVDKTRARAVRAPDDALLTQLSETLGTHFNLGLAKALRSKVVLFVEGQDMKLLRIIAATQGASNLARELGITIIALHGFSNWEHVEPFAWLVETFLHSAVSTYVVLDRDYRSDAAAGAVVQRLDTVGVTAHVWKRKELESYFLHPAAIARLSGGTEASVREALLDVADSLRDRVFARMLDDYLTERKTSPKHRVTHTEEFAKTFAEQWRNEEWRLGFSPPKELLGGLNRSLQSEGKKAVTLRAIARELRSAEIPEEMRAVIREVEDLI